MLREAWESMPEDYRLAIAFMLGMITNTLMIAVASLLL